MPFNLHHWLKKTPQPVTVLADDKRISVPRNARAYRDLVQTILALEPSKLSCLDKDDQVIRSIVLENEETPPPAAATPEQSDLQLFARLLSEAYDKGSRTNQPLVDRAMEFVERNSERLARADAEIDRLRNVINKLNLRIAELSQGANVVESTEGGIVEAMFQGVLAAQAQQPAVAPVTPIAKPNSNSGGKK